MYLPISGIRLFTLSRLENYNISNDIEIRQKQRPIYYLLPFVVFIFTPRHTQNSFKSDSTTADRLTDKIERERGLRSVSRYKRLRTERAIEIVYENRKLYREVRQNTVGHNNW